MKKPPKTELRRRAEAELAKRPSTARRDAAALVHELEVHQVELEMQNQELRESRLVAEAALERYTEVFDFAPVGFATLAVGGAIREINHAGAHILGRERGRLLGKRIQLFVRDAHLVALDALIQNAIAEHGPRRCELELLGESAVVPVNATASVMRKNDLSVLLAFEDISEVRAKAEALARTEQALRDQNARKDDFIAMLSHELRNPLSPMRTSIGVLKVAPPGSEPSRGALEILERSAEHMTRLVDDLLDITRIAHNKFELQRELVEVTQLLRSTLEDQRSAFEKRRQQVRIHGDVEPVWVNGDAIRLVQVFANLLGNARKFTPDGGTIDVLVEKSGQMATVRVRDSGIGISPEVMDHMFEPFQQGPQGLDRMAGGLGLGLALVRSIVELHGGKATVRSAGLGHGTEVLVVLPAEQPRETTPPEEKRTSAVSRRILIVEDMVDAADALRYALTFGGHTVEVAHDGRSAVALAAAMRPDVVLCDLGLPDMDGYAVARALRACPDTKDAKLIALSGYARPEDVERARAAGFDRHISKPPQLKELFALLGAT